MSSSIEQAKQKVKDFVPTLVGRSNFTPWATSLEWILNCHDPLYYKLLIGLYAKPQAIHHTSPTPIELKAHTKWDGVSDYLLSLLHATIHPTLESHINDAKDAFAAYLILHRAFASRPVLTNLMFLKDRRLRGLGQPRNLPLSLRSKADTVEKIRTFPRKSLEVPPVDQETTSLSGGRECRNL